MSKPLLIFDEVTSVKYGQTLNTKFKHSKILLVQNGVPCLGDLSRAAKPGEFQINKKVFSDLKKPSLFSMGKPFDVNIFHFEDIIGFFPCENLEAKDRKTKKTLYNCTFQKFYVYPRFQEWCINDILKLCKDLKKEVEPGKVIFTLEDFKELIWEKASYVLGDLGQTIGYSTFSVENKLIPPTDQLSDRAKEFRKKFAEKMEADFYQYGIKLAFQDH